MARFVIKKLPPHWVFVPSRRQLRDLLSRLGADVRLVELHGTGYARTANRLSLGFVEGRVVDGRWGFYVRLWGVREAAVGGLQGEMAKAALAEVGRYIGRCLSQPPVETSKPSQLRLGFRLDPEGITSECRVKAVDRWSSPTPVWWEKESSA
jgi:hypothetical protein